MAYTWGIPGALPEEKDDEEAVDGLEPVTLTSPSGQTYVVSNPGPFSAGGAGATTPVATGRGPVVPMPSGRPGKYFLAPPYGVEMATGLAGSGRIYYNPPEMWRSGGRSGGSPIAAQTTPSRSTWAPQRNWSSFRGGSTTPRQSSQSRNRRRVR
jgi:hypothetical protein